MVGTAVLDVNETLFSLEPIAARLEEVGLEGRLEMWFARILRDGFAAAAAGTFASFADLARHHLVVLLEHQEEPAGTDRLDHVIDGFTHVTAHPDVEAGLRRLHDAGTQVVTMTNGTASITHSFLEREGLGDLVDTVFDVNEAGRWKPAPQAYQHVLERCGAAADDAALVAVHPWDVLGAQAAGMLGVWVDRAGDPYPDAYPAPGLRCASFTEAAQRLVGRR